jgi:hypothetical protein
MSVSVITKVLIAATATPPAGPYDLTTLSIAKDELQLDSVDTRQDAFLQRGITQVSQAIRNECNRTFQVEAIQDVCYIQQEPFPWQNPAGVAPLQLSRFPLVNSTPVAVTGTTHGNTTVDGLSATAGLVVGMLVFAPDGSIPAGTAIASINTGAGSLVLTQAATSSATLALSTGLQVVQQLGNGLTQTLVYGTDFTVDAELGQLLRLDSFTGVAVKWEAYPTTVQYQAGFAAIPDDLADAVLQMVTARFYARGRDPNIVERTQAQVVGTERFWVGNQPGQHGAFPPAIWDLLDNYRVPVVA